MRIQGDLDGQDEAYYSKYVMSITFTLKKLFTQTTHIGIAKISRISMTMYLIFFSGVVIAVAC